jgi:hypothetical protein
LLSLVLVLAFSAQAFAVDVKFSGSYYAAGMYQDRTSFYKNTTSDGPSTAFYYQRLRVQTDFVVSPGLTLVTRFDALERAWGATRTAASTTFDSLSAGTIAENQNIAFDWAYIHYDSPVGTFRVGYMNDGAWGTVFMDTSTPVGVIAWSQTMGPWYFIVKIVKVTEGSYTAKNTGATTTDLDSDKYAAAFKYTWKSGEAGVLAGYGHNATKRTDANGYKTLSYGLHPYAKTQIGPVKVQAELNYMWGKSKDYESGAADVKLENLGVFVDAVADFGMLYAGGTFAYISGDDPATLNKSEGGSVSGGTDWNPCLIMFNYERNYWAGTLPGYGYIPGPPAYGPNNTNPMSNAWFGQGRVGVRPFAALDILASLSYAQADQKRFATDATGGYATALNSDYGWEVDVTATYKITNNLSYMLGAGYLFTGDYYKGNNDTTDVENNFLVINKLTLTF